MVVMKMTRNNEKIIKTLPYNFLYKRHRNIMDSLCFHSKTIIWIMHFQHLTNFYFDHDFWLAMNFLCSDWSRIFTIVFVCFPFCCLLFVLTYSHKSTRHSKSVMMTLYFGWLTLIVKITKIQFFRKFSDWNVF